MSASTGDDDPSPEFPAGLRVLVVDHDPVHLKHLNEKLAECKYEATTCMESATALSLLHEKEGEFDLVLSDFDMPDMNGFDFLQCIRQEFANLAVVLMSKEYRFDDVRRGMRNGALYHFIKPISTDILRTIWITVMMGRKDDIKDEKEERKKEEERKNEEEHKMQYEERERSPLNNKKRRVVWCDRLHAKFEAAVQQLGIDKAVPKKILELMDEPLLTRENVASHLQKHRAGMKKGSGASTSEVVRDVGPCNIRSQLPSQVQGNLPLVPMNTQVQSCNSGAQLATPLNIRPPALNQRNYISSNNIGNFIPTPQRQQPVRYQNIGQQPALQYQNIGQLPEPRYQNIGQQPLPQYTGASQFLDMPVTNSPGEQHVLQQQITSGHQALIPNDGNCTNSDVGSIRDRQLYFLSKLNGRPVADQLEDWKIALVRPQLDNNQLIGDNKSTPSNDDALNADDIFDILEATD